MFFDLGVGKFLLLVLSPIHVILFKLPNFSELQSPQLYDESLTFCDYVELKDHSVENTKVLIPKQ